MTAKDNEWVAVPRWWFDQKCGGSTIGNNENLIAWRAGNSGVRVVTNAEWSEARQPVRVKLFELYSAMDSSQTVKELASALAKLGIEVTDA